ncbi:MAG: ribonuclease Z [Candidatus Diapherotrites archaeon]|nr:ribonuclease Z [Candidatus Diapherotrites archaeon]
MTVKLVFLGTSCATPTKERNLSAMALTHEGETLLFDTPEQVQQQLMKTRTSYMKIKKILLTHFHADHFIGITGLLATMTLHERTETLTIFGPRGIKEKIAQAIELGGFKPRYQILCREARDGILAEEETYAVRAVKVVHSVPCFGYIFEEKGKKAAFDKAKALALGIPEGPLYAKLQRGENVKVNGKTFKPGQVLDYSKGRKGKKIAYIIDTVPHTAYIKAVEEADVLVHECTFAHEEAERARKVKHSTALQCGQVAKKARVKTLILTHYSTRYHDPKELAEEAKKEFAHTIAAHDLMEYEV